mmetsp:Transcript_28432/g.25279  ORF Transcript_28432/g.25279 Transcript_28432/m.25279 type:complete len:95 (+) Transcript_28432:71-355(+)
MNKLKTDADLSKLDDNLSHVIETYFEKAHTDVEYLIKIHEHRREKLNLADVSDEVLVALIGKGSAYIFGEAEIKRLDKILHSDQDSNERTALKN